MSERKALMSTFDRWKTAFENPVKYHFQDSQFQNFFGEGWFPQTPLEALAFCLCKLVICEVQSQLLFSISLLLLSFLTALIVTVLFCFPFTLVFTCNISQFQDLTFFSLFPTMLFRRNLLSNSLLKLQIWRDLSHFCKVIYMYSQWIDYYIVHYHCLI